MHFKRYFLLYATALLMIFLVAGSYHRFKVAYDYLVYYEGECDPYTRQCFLYCENEECSKPSYYKEVVRRADKLIALCGDDISECEAAKECAESEADCEITYCDPSIKENVCEELGVSDMPVEKPEEGSVIQGSEEVTDLKP